MYLNNYKNKDGVIIFSGMADELFASLSIDGNKQKMTLPNGKWKNVTTSNDVEIIEYADSEGNAWDLTYGTSFPYSYEALNKELLNSIITLFEAQIQELDEAYLKIKLISDTLSTASSKSMIESSIANHRKGMQSVINNIKNELTNSKSYNEGIEDEGICGTEDPGIYGIRSRN